jgi:hypothetical protein
MPYFPDSVMPLSPKQNAVGALRRGNAILAAEFNLIDEEVQAIEQYLLGQKNGVGNFSERIKAVVSSLNAVALRGSISNVISGYCLTGMRLRFPETATTWLTKYPSPTDREIKVNTTRDFPSSGVISIINDVSQLVFNEKESTVTRTSDTGTTSVEWITYDGKTSDSLLNCTRGYMGTYAGTHAGYYPGSVNSTVLTNLSDHCPVTPLKTQQNLCQRRINRPYAKRLFPLFGFSGVLDDLTRQVMLDGPSFRLYPSNPYLQQMRTAFGAVTPTTDQVPTTTWGYTVEPWVRTPYSPAVPLTVTDGIISYGIWKERWAYDKDMVLTLLYAFLQSEDFSYASAGRLTGVEAYDFMDLALANGSISTTDYKSIDWPEKGIPVFSGMLDIRTEFTEWTNTYTTPESPRVVLMADGTVVGYLTPIDNLLDVAQAVIGYSIKLMPGY